MKRMKPGIAISSILTILFLVTSPVSGTAQDCESSLTNAYRQYESGNFQQCIDLLEPCIDHLERRTVYEAYRLMALSYQQLRNDSMLHENIVKLLKKNPGYIEFPMFDPVEFTKNLEKYTVWPGLELGIKGAVSVNSVRPIKNYSVSSNAPSRYVPKAGFQAGITAEYRFMKKTSLGLEVMYEGLNYSRVSDNIFNWKQEYTENLYYFSIPVYLRRNVYTFKEWAFQAELGVQPLILSRASSSIVLTNRSTGQSIQRTATETSRRNKVLMSSLAGVSVKRKIAQATFTAGIRYNYGFTNVVDEDKRYDNVEFIMSNQYVDSDLAFSTWYIFAGIQWPVPRSYIVRLK